MNYNLSKTNKGKEKLHYDGHFYTIHRQSDHKIEWKCQDRTCKARVHTSCDFNNLKFENPFVNHLCNKTISLEEVSAKTAFENIVSTNLFCKPSQLITRFHGETSSSVTFSNDEALRSKIKYARKKYFSETSCYGNVDRDEWEKCVTIDKDKFCLFKSDDLVILGTVENVRRFMLSTEKMGDGTFSLAPKEYQQIFILSAKFYEIWCPLIYLVMKNRKAETYVTALETLLEIANQNEFRIEEEFYILLDFEKSSSKAFKQIFPHCQILRCFFHFWQNILKNIKKRNLYQLYLADNKYKSKIKKIASLAFLPANIIEKEFNEMCHEFENNSREFLTYLRINYISGQEIRTIKSTGKKICSPPKYHPSEWSVFDRLETDIERTTNMQEAFHRKLQSSNLHGDHPTIPKLIMTLLDMNQRISHNMNTHLTAGAPPPKKKRQTKERNENIKRLYDRYCNDNIVLDDYLFGISNNI